VLISVVNFVSVDILGTFINNQPEGSENPYFSAFIAFATSLAVTKPIYSSFLSENKDRKNGIN
jgi:hypothetical protein